MTATTTEVKRNTGSRNKTADAGPLSAEALRKMHAYHRAANEPPPRRETACSHPER
jgi:hypothetical protein